MTDVGERVSLITVGLASMHQSTTYKLYDYIADELMTLLFGSFLCQLAYFLLMALFYHITPFVQESGVPVEEGSHCMRLVILYNSTI